MSEWTGCLYSFILSVQNMPRYTYYTLISQLISKVNPAKTSPPVLILSFCPYLKSVRGQLPFTLPILSVEVTLYGDNYTLDSIPRSQDTRLFFNSRHQKSRTFVDFFSMMYEGEYLTVIYVTVVKCYVT